MPTSHPVRTCLASLRCRAARRRARRTHSHVPGTIGQALTENRFPSTRTPPAACRCVVAPENSRPRPRGASRRDRLSPVGACHRLARALKDVQRKTRLGVRVNSGAAGAPTRDVLSWRSQVNARSDRRSSTGVCATARRRTAQHIGSPRGGSAACPAAGCVSMHASTVTSRPVWRTAWPNVRTGASRPSSHHTPPPPTVRRSRISRRPTPDRSVASSRPHVKARLSSTAPVSVKSKSIT